MSETKLQREILKAFEARGWWAFRVNSGKVKVNGGWMTLAPKGTPDICVLHPVQCWIEVKRPGGKRSDGQIEWHERAERVGLKVATVDSVEAAVKTVRGWDVDR